MTINLSYIIATRNRLPFLKITVEKLLAALQPDEEIVIIDGDSSDGTKEYLQQLFEQKKIHQYLSEPDRNQAHGWNKAMLMAKGTLIKKIIDDDVFCYEAIRHCKAYMLQNPQVDVVLSNDLSSQLSHHQNIDKHTRLPQFDNWRTGVVPSFTFSDVHMLIRRTSLAYIGLYNTNYTMMDWEYALRISYNQANIAYYTGYNALSVTHPQTVTSAVTKQQLDAEGKRGAVFYEYAGDDSEISQWSKLKIMVGKALYKQQSGAALTSIDQSEIQSIYDHYYAYLTLLNHNGDFKFITSR